MNARRLVPAFGLASLVLGLITIPATAATANGTQQAAACQLDLGAMNQEYGLQRQQITAGNPPSVQPMEELVAKAFPNMQVRQTSSWVREPNIAGFDYYGKVTLGASMYSAVYRSDTPDAGVTLTKIGGGWDAFSNYEESRYDEGARPGSQAHTFEYGLRTDGLLFRWQLIGGKWVGKSSSAGFASVKTMALISQTRGYDTFLANTHGGALYTIRIPVSSPLKPIVTKVRGSTWQAFDRLIAERCGQYGTLLLGVDWETQASYLYAVGDANGTSTVINGLGKVPGLQNSGMNFRWTGVAFANPPLNGD
ncbi:hypothetical protein [Kribbella sp. CA-293567]|uniref:hypothetical protein n=1 Tax=Kribbella sp. CA-293567 TaxID=3002436 RepID=UPI0022DD7D74|nr:hypothetical protein [Kribbella sp. CA-293567]WBQ03110.1 hypothetical protein OX958_24385 [Kribbella sp. CA-293567]